MLGSPTSAKPGNPMMATPTTFGAAPLPILLPKVWATPFVMPERKAGAPTEGPDSTVIGAHLKHPTSKNTFEACGEWIQKSLFAAMVKKAIEETESEMGSESNNTAGASTQAARTTKRKGGVKLSDDDLAEDWYTMLELQDQEGATADDVRNAYRKRCVQTHPDKQPDHSDKLFKKVQRAFEILGDEDARRAYDSSRMFDDSIPGEVVPEEKFFELFGPAFQRNSKWSSDGAMPPLGDADSKLKDVKKCYDAWYRFRSWRDFSSQCELEEIVEGMERAEKRYHQRENQRQLDKCMKEEMTRIRQLVDRAHKNDPRIRKEREDEIAAAIKVKEDRERERNKLREEEEERRNYERNREKREAEEAKVKAASEKDRMTEYRNGLVAWFDSKDLLCTIPSNAILENMVRKKNILWLNNKSTADELEVAYVECPTKSTEEVDGKVEACMHFNTFILKKEGQLGVNRYGEACKTTKQIEEEELAKKLAEEEAERKKNPVKAEWNDDDLKHLSKAIAKYPGGTVDRMKRINDMLPNQKKFTEDQIMAKVKALGNDWKGGDIGGLRGQVDPALGAQKVIDTDAKDGVAPPQAGAVTAANNKARLVRILQKYQADKVDQADAMLAKYAGKEDQFFKALINKFGPEPAAPLSHQEYKDRMVRFLSRWQPEKVAQADAMLAKYPGKEEQFFEALVKKFGPEPPVPAKHADPNGDEWTLAQQKQLEDALRELKDYKEKDKFVKVAETVEGKDGKQCFDRYKYLCELNKQ